MDPSIIRPHSAALHLKPLSPRINLSHQQPPRQQYNNNAQFQGLGHGISPRHQPSFQRQQQQDASVRENSWFDEMDGNEGNSFLQQQKFLSNTGSSSYHLDYSLSGEILTQQELFSPNSSHHTNHTRSVPSSRPGTAKKRKPTSQSRTPSRPQSSKRRPQSASSSRSSTRKRSATSTPSLNTSLKNRPNWNHRFFINGESDDDVGEGTNEYLSTPAQALTGRAARVLGGELGIGLGARAASTKQRSATGRTHRSRPNSAASRSGRKSRSINGSSTMSNSSSRSTRSRPSSALRQSSKTPKKRKKNATKKKKSSRASPSPSQASNLFLNLSENLPPSDYNLNTSRDTARGDPSSPSSIFKSVISARSARRDTGHNILQSYEASKERIRKLWEETNIRHTERMDFEANHFLKHPTHENMDVVFAYEQDLQYYKEMTICILQLIEMREQQIEALHRFTDTYGNHGDSRQPLKTSTTQLSQQLKILISKIRYSTLDIVENIVEWRSIMTYPKPFFFDNENYLLKMRNDLTFFAQSSLASYVSDLHLPFEEYSSSITAATEGNSPPKIKLYQKRYLMNTLPSISQGGTAHYSTEEWHAFRDRVYRAFHVLATEEDENAATSDPSLLVSAIQPSDASIQVSSIHHSISSENGSFSPRTPHTLCKITFVSHFEANQQQNLSTLLEPVTARSSRRRVIQHGAFPQEEQELLKMHKAATKLQSVFKGWYTRNALRNELRYSGNFVKRPLDSETARLMQEALKMNSIREDDYEKLESNMLLQSGIRTILSTLRAREYGQKRTSSTLLVQRLCRKTLAIQDMYQRKHAHSLGRIVWMQSVVRMTPVYVHFASLYQHLRKQVVLIQRSFRMRMACVRILWELEEQIRASKIIQRSTRRWLSRKHFHEALNEHRAASVIERAVRGYLAKKYAQKRRIERAAIVIQACIRSQLIQSDVRQSYHCITLVQSGARTLIPHLGHVVRTQSIIRSLLLQEMHTQHLEDRKVELVMLCQSHARQRLVAVELGRTIEDVMQEADSLLNDPFFTSLSGNDGEFSKYDPVSAAEMIQRCYRGHAARQRTNELRKQREKETQEALENELIRTRIGKRIGRCGIPLHMQMIELDRSNSKR